MIRQEEIVRVGMFNKPHGIDGEITASVDFDVDDIKQFSCLITDVEGIFVPFFVNAVRTKSSQSLLLKIDGIENETDAIILVNKPIYVLKSEFGELECFDDDEIPIDCLVGYSVSQQGESLGRITRIDDSTANVLFVITDSSNRELLVPAVDDFIEAIDTEKQEILLAAPPEIINLQL